MSSSSSPTKQPTTKATVAQLVHCFPDVDEGLVQCIHDDEGGILHACHEQLSALSESGARMDKKTFVAWVAEKNGTNSNVVVGKQTSSSISTSSAGLPLPTKATAKQLYELAFPDLDEGLIESIHEEEGGTIAGCYAQLSAFGEAKMSKNAFAQKLAKMSTAAADDADDGPGGEAMTRESTMMDTETTSSELQMNSRQTTGIGADLYDAALPTDMKELKERNREIELNELMQAKLKDIEKLVSADREFDKKAGKQKKLGPQSLRHNTGLNYKVGGWAGTCFRKMIDRETEHCGEFVCFYHSFSHSMLLYEVQTCIARTIYGLRDDFPPMARLLKKPFLGKPHIQALLDYFTKSGQQDHDLGFREVAISTSVSLGAPGSEAPPMQVFDMGYSIGVHWRGLLENILKKTGVAQNSISSLADQIAKVGSDAGLLGSSYGGGGGCVQSAHQGHMVQIFVRVDCVDDIAYGSHAMGVYDPNRNPLSEYLLKDQAPDSQARVFWHPALFHDESKVKVYHYPANQDYVTKRASLQQNLYKALLPHLFNTPQKLLKTFRGVEGIEDL